MGAKKIEGTLLTAYARTRLERALLDQVRAKMKDRFDAESDVLAKAAIKEVYGEDAFEKFAAVPAGWLSQGREFTARLADEVSGYGVHLHLTESIPMPYGLNRNSIRVSKKLYAKMEAHKVAYDKAQAEYGLLSGYNSRSGRDGQINQALRAIKTVEELQEKWPEAYALLPAEDGGQGCAPKYNLPALPIADAIGLYKKLCS